MRLRLRNSVDFPQPARADQRGDLVARDVERDVADRGESAVPDTQVTDLEDRVGGRTVAIGRPVGVLDPDLAVAIRRRGMVHRSSGAGAFGHRCWPDDGHLP
jgi:hypothetical protein